MASFSLLCGCPGDCAAGDALDVAEFNLMHPADQWSGADAAATTSIDPSEDSPTAAEAGKDASSSSTLPAFDEAYDSPGTDNLRHIELTPGAFHHSVPGVSGAKPAWQCVTALPGVWQLVDAAQVQWCKLWMASRIQQQMHGSRTAALLQSDVTPAFLLASGNDVITDAAAACCSALVSTDFHAEARASFSVPPPSAKTQGTAGAMKATTQHKSRAAGLSWQQGQWEDRAALQQEYEDYEKGKRRYEGALNTRMCWCWCLLGCRTIVMQPV